MTLRQSIYMLVSVLSVAFVCSIMLLALPVSTTYADELHSDSMYAQMVAPSYKLYSNSSALCSATVVKSKKNDQGQFETYLLTAAHCVRPNMNIRSQVLDKKMNVVKETVFYLKPFRVLKDKDVAVLRVLDGDNSFPVATVAPVTEKLALGRSVWAVGYPKGFELTVTKGMFTGKAKTPGGEIFNRATAPIAGGNSGGALYIHTDDGYVVAGVTSAHYRDTSFMNYFALLESIHRAIPKVSVRKHYPAP